MKWNSFLTDFNVPRVGAANVGNVSAANAERISSCVYSWMCRAPFRVTFQVVKRTVFISSLGKQKIGRQIAERR